MLVSAVSVLVVAQSSSEIPDGLMNNPVVVYTLYQSVSSYIHWILQCMCVHNTYISVCSCFVDVTTLEAGGFYIM